MQKAVSRVDHEALRLWKRFNELTLKALEKGVIIRLQPDDIAILVETGDVYPYPVHGRELPGIIAVTRQGIEIRIGEDGYVYWDSIHRSSCNYYGGDD